jgi:hypothetical protein
MAPLVSRDSKRRIHPPPDREKLIHFQCEVQILAAMDVFDKSTQLLPVINVGLFDSRGQERDCSSLQVGL